MILKLPTLPTVPLREGRITRDRTPSTAPHEVVLCSFNQLLSKYAWITALDKCVRLQIFLDRSRCIDLVAHGWAGDEWRWAGANGLPSRPQRIAARRIESMSRRPRRCWPSCPCPRSASSRPTPARCAPIRPQRYAPLPVYVARTLRPHLFCFVLRR